MSGLLNTTMLKIRKLLQWVWVCALSCSGCLAYARNQIRRRGGVIVLTLHRVLDDRQFEVSNSPRGMILSRRAYGRLCSWISAKYEACTLGGAQPGQPGPRLRVLLTFDDGWADTLEIAVPAAQHCGLPCTVFICSSLVGKTSPFWPERVLAAARAADSGRTEEDLLSEYKKLPQTELKIRIAALPRVTGTDTALVDRTFTWSEAKAAAARGVVFGSHTASHELLTSLTDEVVRSELAGSKLDIASQIGSDCFAVAYPNGNTDPRIRATAGSLGYALGFTTRRGVWTESCDPLEIPRCNIYDGNVVNPFGRFSSPMFEYTTVWKAWRALRRCTTKSAAHTREAKALTTAAAAGGSRLTE
jgi:peptidoglycan/xylan/chitin deacetylase (PgdA/CDA1 family)